MITRLERSPDGLLIESRIHSGWRQFAPVVLASAMTLTIVFGVFYALIQMMKIAGIPHTFVPRWGDPRFWYIIGAAVAGVLLVLRQILRLALLSERLVIDGVDVTYESYIAALRVQRTQHRLLDMRGLRWDLRLAVPTSASASDNSRAYQMPWEWRANPGGPTMAVWADGGPFPFGYSYSPEDVETVSSALLDYDADLRAAAGVNPESGLRDQSVWTSSRTMTLDPMWADPSFKGGRYGRMRDYDR